jgi:hypothetical protein
LLLRLLLQMWVWLAPNHIKAIWKVLVSENSIVKRLFKFEIGFAVSVQANCNGQAGGRAGGWVGGLSGSKVGLARDVKGSLRRVVKDHSCTHDLNSAAAACAAIGTPLLRDAGHQQGRWWGEQLGVIPQGIGRHLAASNLPGSLCSWLLFLYCQGCLRHLQVGVWRVPSGQGILRRLQ